jgi:hypothetical protein
MVMPQPRLRSGVEFAMMRIAITWRLRACVLALLSVVGARAGGTNALDLFTSAIQNHSTAPNYVLITVIDGSSRSNRVVCTEAPFLLGAIHREHNLGYDKTSLQKVDSLALAQRSRTFKFSNPEAIKNVQPRYTEGILDEVRRALKHYTDDELRQGLRLEGTELSKLYDEKPGRAYGAYRDAIAHVLLERGLLPRRGCVVGRLTIDN